MINWLSKSITILLLVVISLFCNAQTTIVLDDSAQTVKIPPDSIMKLQILKNKYSLYWDFFMREPPYLFSPFYNLKQEDSSVVERYYDIEAPNIQVHITSFYLDTINFEFEMDGFITGGWYGAGSYAHIIVGELNDTIIPIYFIGDINRIKGVHKNDTDPYYEYLEDIYIIKNYTFSKSEVGYKHKKERKFSIKFSINKNSLLIFGQEGYIVKIFDIGKLFKYK